MLTPLLDKGEHVKACSRGGGETSVTAVKLATYIRIGEMVDTHCLQDGLAVTNGWLGLYSSQTQGPSTIFSNTLQGYRLLQ